MNKFKNSFSLNWIMGLIILFSFGFSACEASTESNVAAKPASLSVPPPATKKGSEASGFEAFLRKIPEISLPHEVSPKLPQNNAAGQTAQALSPKALTAYLGREAGKGFLYAAYGKYALGDLVVVIFQGKKAQTGDYTYFARTFSNSGEWLAEHQIAETKSDATYSWITYAKLSKDGTIRSHGYQSLVKTEDLFKENYACNSIAENGEFSPCEIPAAALFLGRFKSKSPVDGDGGFDVWQLSTFTPKGETLPKVALSRCYLNGEGQLDQCKEVGLVTKENFDGDSFHLIIDDITGEMVPTYRISKGNNSSWTLAVHWYDAASDSWIDDELDSEF
ncbi:MAG TPA: hypothetical protein ENJ82_01280 [Bacteroidetes bacterium]|nr:hypothetical protein [Bacteroidota bacterium]